MRQYRLGLIGLGAFGQFCLDAYSKMPEVQIVAISDTDKDKLDSFGELYKIDKRFSDYRELLEEKDIDVVAIFTPPHLHAEMAIEAAKAKKGFMCEKPLALSVEDANRILDAVRDNGVAASIDYVMRYTEIYQEISQIAQENKFGKLKHLLFENYASREGLSDNHWLFKEEISGGILVEHGVHFFDIFTKISGAKAEETVGFNHKHNEALAIVRYPEDVTASFYHIFDKMTVTERNYARFIFERGYAHVIGWIPMKLELEWQEPSGEIRQETREIKMEKEEYYTKLVQEALLDLLKQMDDPQYKPKVTLEDGRDSLAIAIDAKKRSIF